jgi:hypothetical protein
MRDTHLPLSPKRVAKSDPRRIGYAFAGATKNRSAKISATAVTCYLFVQKNVRDSSGKNTANFATSAL